MSIGQDFTVNTTAVGTQGLPSITALPGGRFVITWQSGSSSDYDIRGRLFNADGSAAGTEFLVNTTTAGQQRAPSVTALTDGRFVITWGSNSDIHGRLFDADGSASGSDFVINAAAGGSSPSVTALPDGRFVVTWEGAGIHGRLFNADGSASGNDFVVDATVSGQLAPSVAALPDGRFIVTWQSDEDNPTELTVYDIRGRLFNADGSAAGTEFLVNTTTAKQQRAPAVTTLADGRFLVTWASSGPGDIDIRGRFLNDDGSADDDDFLINTTTAKYQQEPAVTTLADGRFVVTWQSGGSGYYDIRGRLFNADGSAVDDDFLINTITPGSQTSPAITALANGRFVVTWQSDGIQATIFDVTGSTEGDDLINRGAGDDALYGGAGNDVLNGGAGADIMRGGTGDDTYIIDNDADRAIEADGEGIDTVESSVSFSLSRNYIEKLVLTGSVNINGTGNSLANTIIGNAGKNILTGVGGDDILDGGAGADTMKGGPGDDTYIVDNASDTAIESKNEGNDTVQSSVSFNLAGSYLENIVLTGSDDINAVGNSLANTIIGNSGNNKINGRGGADIMQGGLGNDTYVVDDVGDRVFEAAGEGTDIVQSSVSFSMSSQEIETLILTGSANINGGGNSLANTIIGNAGNNKINGRGGADTMQGGTGNDTYVVDDVGDRVFEADGEGTDIVQSSVSFGMGSQEIETLILTGSANINGGGNSLANTIIGNVGNNKINGRGGADIMKGGAGNDTYIVDDAGDQVIEASGQGTDTVQSSVAFSLSGSFVENLILTGSANINGGGNSLDNSITGNSGSNVLNGRGGNDTLTGNAGADAFVFNTALNASTNVDTITDFQVNLDKIRLDVSIFAEVGAGLSASEFVANASGTATTSAQNILYDTTDGRLFYDPDGTGAQARVHFATLSAGLALDHLDFVVI